MNKNEQTFESMLNESWEDYNVDPESVVESEVIAVDHYNVTLAIFSSVEGFVPLGEFEELPKVGDKVQVIVSALDDGNGNVKVSHTNAVDKLTRERLISGMENKAIFQAKVMEARPAGLLVKIATIDGFLPRSQIDTFPVNPHTLVGTTINVVPLNYDEKKNNVVVSRKEALMQERGGAIEKLVGELKVGDVREGIVKNVLKFGAFVELGGKDCLVHLTDASWNPLEVDPFQFFQVGQRVTGVINKTDHLNRFYMSLRGNDMTPWENIKKNRKIGEVVDATVYKLDDNRNLLVVVDGVLGVVKQANISWGHTKSSELKELAGKQVKAVVTGFDDTPSCELVELSMKECTTNPWKRAAKELVVGREMEVEIKAVTEHNFFVPVAEGVDAIVPSREICWKDPARRLRELSNGMTVKVKLIHVDHENQKVTASLRECEADPFSGLKKGSAVDLTVTGFSRNGDCVFLSVDDTELEAFSTARHATPARAVLAEDFYNIGEKVVGKVINIDAGRVLVNLRDKSMSDILGASQGNSSMKEALLAAQSAKA